MAGAALALLTLILAACAGPSRQSASPGGRGSDDSRAAVGVPPIEPAKLHAVLINGGGERRGNYYSHLVHLRALLGVLERAGVPAANVSVFASDGEDPAPDLAIRELRPEGESWLLDGTRLAATIGEPLEYVNTELPGRTIRPATRAELERWFAGEGRLLGSGDTLLFYVTDHGTRGKEGPRDNRISLWGKEESLSVDDLDRLLSQLDPGVRVVALMSQCFSGGFGLLAAGEEGALPERDLCGFYSSTPDRPAYGCYAEVRDDDDIGHSIRFIEALAAGRSFEQSHRHALVADHTPDVPLRSSDFFLRERLERAAEARGLSLERYVDELLAVAWREREAYEADLRLLDRIGQVYGFASPRSLEELEKRLEQLPSVGDVVSEHADAWSKTRDDVARANLRRFLAAHPIWTERVAAERTRSLSPQAARSVGDELLAELGPFTKADRDTDRRLRSLRERAEVAGDVAYRMAVREAALLRMEAILMRIAGRIYLRDHAGASEREAFARIETCEALDLPLEAGSVPAPRAAFPSYSDDVKLAEAVLPGWMGIQFRQAPSELRRRYGLADGAVSVQRVYPGSPAERAGLAAGDVVIGPPGTPFVEPNQIREWTMLSAIDEAQPLEVLRDGTRMVRELVPAAHPGRFPELPGPLRVGAAAPAIEVERYRGEIPTSLADGRTRLLFFWATWCAPCKASLPEVLEFAHQRDVEILAVTDESAAQLDAFFTSFGEPFPVNVAIDVDRDAFLEYGVSGTPTFVLIDSTGRIAHYNTGYDLARGLGFPGWKRG